LETKFEESPSLVIDAPSSNGGKNIPLLTGAQGSRVYAFFATDLLNVKRLPLCAMYTYLNVNHLVAQVLAKYVREASETGLPPLLSEASGSSFILGPYSQSAPYLQCPPLYVIYTHFAMLKSPWR
jgi:hypothetical protein